MLDLFHVNPADTEPRSLAIGVLSLILMAVVAYLGIRFLRRR